MTKGYMQISENEWIQPNHGGFIHQCCHCNLVHDFKFAVVDRKTKEPVTGVAVQFKLVIDRRKTAASRRKLKFTKEQD